MLKLKLQYFGYLMRRSDSWKRLWCWERLKAGGEGDDREWDGWMASLTQWMWVWVNSGSWWWTGRPGVLRFMGSQRVGHDWATDLIWSEPFSLSKLVPPSLPSATFIPNPLGILVHQCPVLLLDLSCSNFDCTFLCAFKGLKFLSF